VQFAELLARVAAVDPELRVRFTSPHPKDFSDDVLQVGMALMELQGVNRFAAGHCWRYPGASYVLCSRTQAVWHHWTSVSCSPSMPSCAGADAAGDCGAPQCVQPAAHASPKRRIHYPQSHAARLHTRGVRCPGAACPGCHPRRRIVHGHHHGQVGQTWLTGCQIARLTCGGRLTPVCNKSSGPATPERV
jgi:hypothetical protein